MIPQKITFNKWVDKDGGIRMSGYVVGEHAIDPLTGESSVVLLINIKENRCGGTAYVKFESGTVHKINDINEIIGTETPDIINNE